MSLMSNRSFLSLSFKSFYLLYICIIYKYINRGKFSHIFMIAKNHDCVYRYRQIKLISSEGKIGIYKNKIIN